ncbi:MAG: integrase, partial [Betaproteobacteria bacterium]|nr:integrase [Betaproteobacteria bacterium]
MNKAKRKWAELECREAPPETGLMSPIFSRYEREVIPKKAPKTQLGNLSELAMLRKVFDAAPIDAITPQHVAQYRDKRGAAAPVRANRELALLSHVFNLAREWGYTAKENPCRGVRKNRETPRD